MYHRTKITAAMIAATLALPAVAAQAHVTLQPFKAEAGGFTRLDVRVPNEKDNRGTRKVEVQMPPGFLFVSYEQPPGWTVKVTKRKLGKPVEAFGDKISEEVGKVSFTATGEASVVGPGEFRDFGLSVGVPKGKAGTKLTFKALQTYEGGEVVRWIGVPDSDEPAPQVTLTAGEGEEAAAHGDKAKTGGTDAATASKGEAEPASVSSDDDSATLAIIALAVGALGLAAGSVALVTSRRRLA